MGIIQDNRRDKIVKLHRLIANSPIPFVKKQLIGNCAYNWGLSSRTLSEYLDVLKAAFKVEEYDEGGTLMIKALSPPDVTPEQIKKELEEGIL